MQTAYFELWCMSLGGELASKPIICRTLTGLILQCHAACDVEQVRYLAEIARETPNYPVDLTAWVGNLNDRKLTWNARIYYRSAGYVQP